MSRRFEIYAETKIGRLLVEIIDSPDRFFEFGLLSNLGKPAVQAIAASVKPLIMALPTKADRDAANQFCGWYVGQLMRGSNYEIVSERGRVLDASFKTGAVWKQKKGPKIVTSVPEGGRARIDFRVKKEHGDIVADWETVISASDPVRRIRQIGGLKQPVHDAFHDAIEYAQRRGIPVLFIQDSEQLFPKMKWGVSEQ